MDEKKVMDAIEGLKIEIQTYEDMIFCRKHFEPENDCGSYEEKIVMCKTAIEALEKQLPKKGIKEKITEGAHKGLHNFFCPICYEKGDLSNKCNVGQYCPNCGQRLDWSET